MLNINCILPDLANQLKISEEYGLCKPHLISKLKCATSYYWLYNNAWSCLDDCQKKDLEVFIKNNFNCTSYNGCEDVTIDCTSLTIYDYYPFISPCSSTLTITEY